jgi:DNA-binding ferritin-like protein
MTNLVSMLFHSVTQAHVFHLRAKGFGSYSAHKALQTYYEDIVDLIDELTEGYQGKKGLIEFKAVKGLDNDASLENVVSYFESLAKFVENERKSEKLNISFIQNEIDNVEKLIYSTLYKLRKLQ